MVILCTIDLETREVSLPAGQVIASYDHNVDVIRFQAEAIPGFSLDTSSIRIAAQGPNKARHDYAVDPSTVAIEEETGYITFDWPIPAGVTEMPIGSGFKYGDRGQLIFAVCAEIIDGSTVSKAWHSDDGIITVVAHLEPEAGGGEDPEEEATNRQMIGQLQTDVAVVQRQVAGVAGGVPTVVDSVSDMTDTNKIYVLSTDGKWYYHDGTTWTSGGTYGGAVTSTTFNQHGVPADDFAVGEALAEKADADDVTAVDTRVTAVEGDVDDINDRLTNDYIPVDGENLVAPQNIQGVTFTKTTEEIAGDNIFSSDLLFEENYYVSINTSANPPVITHTSTSGYKAYCVPVDGVSKYTFTSARFACLAKGDTLGSEAVGTLQTYATSIVTTGANYLFLTYTSSTDFDNIEVHKITEQDAYANFEMPEWSGIPALQNRVYELQYLAGVNLFDHAELIKENGYAAISNGKITFANLSGYNAYLLPVDGKSIYTFTRCRFAFLVDSDKESAIGDLLQNISQIDSTGASYIAFSFNTSSYPLADYSVVGEIHINTNKLPFAVVTGDISSGGDLQLPSTRSNLRKGERVVFEGNITNFSTLIIGLTRFTSDFGNDTNRRNVFTVDDTNITYKAYPSATAVTVPHGLTISENIQIIWEMTATASCKITLISDGVLFSHEFTNFVRQVIGNPFVYSADSVLTGCKLTWICTDIDKDIWMFGDSYFAYAEARWTYYLHQYGYDNNCLLDGFPGEGSTNGRVAFDNLLQYGTPKMAVWCLGMNDGGDSDSAPSVNWVSARDSFLQYCQSNNVEPIFGTIPTVPSINHEEKNAWIRSSGYRYIDFAKAVGASASGVWFSGMLSSDNVHPTPQGARALFARVLLDLPEIMVDDFE